MTFEEAYVCFKYRYPVICSKDPYIGQTYFIRDVLKCRTIYKEGIIASATIEKDERSCAQVKASDLSPVNGYETYVQNKIKEMKNEQFKDFVKELLAAGMNQTQILEHVKKIVVKAEE